MMITARMNSSGIPRPKANLMPVLSSLGSYSAYPLAVTSGDDARLKPSKVVFSFIELADSRIAAGSISFVIVRLVSSSVEPSLILPKVSK